MKRTFEKQNFNEQVTKKEDYVKMFLELGYEAYKVDISYTNGLSAYITLNVNVLNENAMYADAFVYEGKCTLKVRVSDHLSGLEINCGGVCNNKLSYNAFISLINDRVISA